MEPIPENAFILPPHQQAQVVRVELKIALVASVLVLAGIAAAFSLAGGPGFPGGFEEKGVHNTGHRMGWNSTNKTGFGPFGTGWNSSTNGTGCMPQFGFGPRTGWNNTGGTGFMQHLNRNNTNMTDFGQRPGCNGSTNGTGWLSIWENDRTNEKESERQRMWGNGGMNNTNRPRPQREGNGSMNETQFSQLQSQFESAVLSGDYATAKELHSSYGFGGRLFGKLDESTFAQYSQLRKLESALLEKLGEGPTQAASHAQPQHHRAEPPAAPPVPFPEARGWTQG